ncbi:MAG TPA: hypothetical protein VIJ47_14890 [Acidimicrobiales bacterium]
MAVLAAGCGSAKSTASTDPTGAVSYDRAAFCADLNAPVPPIATPPAGGAGTAQAFRDQYAAGLPHWEQIQADAPPQAAADVAPIIAAIRKVVALDPALSDAQTAQAAGAIMNAPELRAALADLGSFASPICQG